MRASEIERFNCELINRGHGVFVGEWLPRAHQFDQIHCVRFLDRLDDEAALAVAGDGGFVAREGKLARNADGLASSVAEDADGTGLGGGGQRGCLCLSIGRGIGQGK
jgi:hypothetical protein